MKTLCIYLLTAVTALGALPPEWKNVQTFDATAPGLMKIDLPAATLNAARPGLEDLRVFDPEGHEVPYFLSRPLRRTSFFLMPKTFSVSLAGQTTVMLIGIARDHLLEAVTLETPASGFIKAVKVEGSKDQKKWTTLATGQPIFRQPNGVAQLRVNFPEGNWPWLRVTVDDQRSEAIPFTGARLHELTGELAVGESVNATLVDRTENNGQTRLTLDLGAANLTLSSVRIETDEQLFTRSVAIAVRQVNMNTMTESVLGRGTVYRVAIEGQPVSVGLDIPLNELVPARELLVLIENQDSPPLPVSTVIVKRLPVHLIFRAAEKGTYRIVTGNPHCAIPRYDLAALRSFLATVPLPVTATRLGPVTPNPSYKPAEPLPEIENLGVPLDVSEWILRKRVEMERAGVQQVELDLDVLAHADPSFRDLRLMRDGQQRPYIVERTSIQRKLVPEVSMANDPKRPTVSRWKIKLPQSRLPVGRLTCATQTPLFRRDVRLYEEVTDANGESYQHPLADATWVRTPPVTGRSLELSFPSPATDTVFLETDNGDNPAIVLENFQCFYPATRLWFKAPPEPATWLYYGNREAGSPQYDLDLIAARLLAEEKATAKLGTEELLKKNGTGEFFRFAGTKSIIFWVALAVAVIVLLLVVAKLLPKETKS
jgi:hypothetical protein